MPSLTSNEIVTYKHKRNYIQFGGPRPLNLAQYSGQDAQYMVIEGVGLPEAGAIDPIWAPDPRRLGSYRLVGRKITPPALATATVKLYEKHGSIPRQLQQMGCQFNMYELTGNCKDLSDFNRGWTDYILIYARALVLHKDLGTRSALDTDEHIEDSLSIMLEDIYPVGALYFGEQAAIQIDREVVDVVYGSSIQCGDCGPQDEGLNRIYAITKSSGIGSPGLPAEVIYSVDGGITWNDLIVTGMTATADGTAIEVVGDKLVVVVNADNAYYWATINAFTGVPGAFTKVTAGFVAGKAPNDLYVASPREIYFAANGGYIYKSTDITAGVVALNAATTTTVDLLRVHGRDEAIVFTGRSSTVVKSVNRGATFGITTTNPVGTSLDVTAVAVLDNLRYWVGTGASGHVYFTLNGGETWVDMAFDTNGQGTVRDIVFATDEVGYFSHDTNTPTARVFSTWNGGKDWIRDAPRINALPVFNRANRLAIPVGAAPGLSANNLAVAGLSGGGVDGVLYLGIASRL